MITTTQITELITEKLTEKECFLVDLVINEDNNILVEVDSLKGVSVQDCIDVSRAIENNLDREVEDFELQVSSAGLDKPLRVREQYVKNVGRTVKVVSNEGLVVKGTLTEVREEEIVIEFSVKEKIEGKKKKQTIIKQEEIPFENIKETTIIISFK